MSDESKKLSPFSFCDAVGFASKVFEEKRQPRIKRNNAD